MNNKSILQRYYQIISFTLVMIALFMFFKGVSLLSVSMSVYIALCCALCIYIAHLRNTGVLNYKERWLLACLLGVPILYFLSIMFLRTFFYEAYGTYISLFSTAEKIVAEVIPAMGKTERDLVKLGLYERVSEVRHNFFFVAGWSCLTAYLIFSHSISMSDLEKQNVLNFGFSETKIIGPMKAVIFILCILMLSLFNISLVRSESCSVRCGGAEDDDIPFLVLNGMAFFVSYIVSTLLFKNKVLSEYSNQAIKQKGEASNE
ncbi:MULTISPECIES: hypothetical protein [unclassified Endozoicomonas]|uniref:hypothetical protein n=1 Tax=unclassified Endozoicomonas TaxID=2644528 RepID=UPI003BB6B48F